MPKRLPFLISNIFSDIKMLVVIVNCLFEISEAVKSIAKATIRGLFSFRVSKIFGNFKVAFEVFYGLLEVSKTFLNMSKVTIRISCPIFVS